MADEVKFEDLPIPDYLGTFKFRPTVDAVKKMGYAVEDETGWFLDDSRNELVHPVFLSNYLWWPEGFYVQEESAIGHVDAFKIKYPAVIDPVLLLHSKTDAEFHNPYRIGKALIAKVSLIEKYERRGKQFIAIEAEFTDEDGSKIARFVHGVMVKSLVPLRMGGVK